eukprot:10457923-Ditylum_brightwellii.AAC.1
MLPTLSHSRVLAACASFVSYLYTGSICVIQKQVVLPPYPLEYAMYSLLFLEVMPHPVRHLMMLIKISHMFIGLTKD